MKTFSRKSLKLNVPRQISWEFRRYAQFCFEHFDCIGFDLDNTITEYKIEEFIKLGYNAISSLVQEIIPFYAKHVSNTIDMDFIIRGLCVDMYNGNVLQIGPNGTVLTAFHGTKRLEGDLLKQYYPNYSSLALKMFSDAPLEMWYGPKSFKIRAVIDYFDSPMALVFARIVDTMDERNGGPLNKYTCFTKIIDIVTDIYKEFSDASPVFSEFKRNTDMYFSKRDDKFLRWLKSFKDSGKVVFLVTGSGCRFANFTANYTIGPDWKSYFDVIVYRAKKPSFFYMKRPFKIPNTADVIEIGPQRKEYEEGNYDNLKELLKSLSKKSNPRIVYVGDNFIADIYGAHMKGAQTVAVCRELFSEDSYELKNIPTDIPLQRSRYWGTPFTTCTGKQTVWMDILQKHAVLHVPCLSLLAQYPLDHEFHSILTKTNS